MITLIYYSLILFLIVYLVGVSAFLITGLASTLLNAPYVGTKQEILSEIFNEPWLQSAQSFIDLGSGDGRVVRFIAQNYPIPSIVGYEYNPFLVLFSRVFLKWSLGSKTNNQPKIIVKNIFDANVTQADVIYVYLMPKFLSKLSKKILKESPKGTYIISHTFAVSEFTDYLLKTKQTGKLKTFYYRLK